MLEGATGGLAGLAVGAGAAGLIITGVAMGVSTVTGALGGLMEASSESQRIQAQTNAVLKSTGDISGETAAGVQAIGQAIEATTPISHDAAESATNMLLTFTNIGHTTMPAATQAVADLATAMNGGLTPSSEQLINTSIQVGKAMNGMSTGVTALQREGVGFTNDQKAVIKSLFDTGQAAKAQQIILSELNKEFGGGSAAQLNTYQGQMDQLKNKFHDVTEALGNALTPALMDMASMMSGFLTNALIGIEQNMGKIQAAFTVVGGVISVVSQVISGNIQMLVNEFTTLGNVIAAIFSGNFEAIPGIVEKGVNRASEIVTQGYNGIGNTISRTANNAANEWVNGAEKQKAATVSALNGANQAYDNSASKIADAIAKENAAYAKALEDRADAFRQSLDDMIRASQDKVASLNQQLADENSSFSENMAQEAKDFSATMEQIKSDHKDKVDNITQNIQEEKDSFKSAMADELASFQATMDTMSMTHDQKVQKITRDMEREAKFGQTQNDAKYLDLKQSLGDENAAYALQVSQVTAKENEKVANMTAADTKKLTAFQTELDKEAEAYQDSIAKATAAEQQKTNSLQEQHNKQTANIQAQLKKEQDLLNAHHAEVAQADKDANLDAITRLENTFKKQNADALANHLQKLKDVAAQGGAQSAAYTTPLLTGAGVANGQLVKGLKDAGNTMTDNFVKSMDQAGSQAGQKLVDSFLAGIGNKAKDLAGKAGQATGSVLNFMFAGTGIPEMLKAAGIVKQAGGVVPGPIGAAVPIIAHGGEYVTPNGVSPNQGSGSGSSVVFNVNIGLYAGDESEKRNIAKMMYASLLQLAQSQHKSVADYMGG